MYKKSLMNIAIVVAALIFGTRANAQIKLFSHTQVPFTNKEVHEKLSQRAFQGKVLSLEFKVEIKDVPSIIVEVDSEEIEFFLDEMDTRQNYDYSWYGRSIDKTSSMALTYLDGELAGSIFNGTRNFLISPDGKGRIFLYEKSLENILPDHSDLKTQNPEILIPKTYRQEPSNLRTSLVDGVRKIRILLAYTDAAETGILSLGYTVQLFLQNAITVTNQTFINSNVAHRVRLACGVRTFYNPSSEAQGHNNAAHRLRILNDGYMDEIITHRDNYSADVCVVIINNTSDCGTAEQIGSNSASAYASVHWDCITSNNTLGHEIGHLHGCRHNPEEDNSTYPTAYGHGFRNDANNFRTVMSYNCSPGCPRVPYWSNPDIFYGSVAMGTVNTHDNARLLDETSGVMSNFRTAPSSITLTSTSNLVYKGYGEAIATSEIILSDGLEVALGCELNVFADPAAGGNDYFPFRIVESPMIKEENDVLSNNSSFAIFPNPTTNGQINIQPSTIEEFDVSVVDLNGREIYKSIGKRNAEIKLNNYKPGLYIIKIRSSDKVYTNKILLN